MRPNHPFPQSLALSQGREDRGYPVSFLDDLCFPHFSKCSHIHVLGEGTSYTRPIQFLFEVLESWGVSSVCLKKTRTPGQDVESPTCSDPENSTWGPRLPTQPLHSDSALKSPSLRISFPLARILKGLTQVFPPRFFLFALRSVLSLSFASPVLTGGFFIHCATWEGPITAPACLKFSPPTQRAR